MSKKADSPDEMRAHYTLHAQLSCAWSVECAPTREEADSAVLPFMVVSCPNEPGQPQRVIARFEDVESAMIYKTLDLVLEAGSVHALRFTADMIEGLVEGEQHLGARSPNHATQLLTMCTAMRALANHIDSAAPSTKKDLH